MMTDDHVVALKARICDAVDGRADGIIDFAKDVQAKPELGYREAKTTEKIVSLFEDLGLDVGTELAITGARARAGSGGFVAAVLDKLDALVNPNHPTADPEIGAAHACDYNAQSANLMRTAFGLVGGSVVDDLGGTVEFVAVPAEGYLDLDYRHGLPDTGGIELFGGRQELIRRGCVDDWDIVAMIHTGSDTPGQTITSNSSISGLVGKSIIYRGTGAHAGAAPEEGVNTLNTVILGMSAVHAQRECFRDENHVRVRPTITRGGDGINIVPVEVTMESYVRMASVETVVGANESADRAFASGAMGVGGNVEIEDYLGYIPLQTDGAIVMLYDESARDIAGPDAAMPETPHLSESTDMGGIARLVPSIHPRTGDLEGVVYVYDPRVTSEGMAYVIPAKLTAYTLVDLLTSPEAAAVVRETKVGKRSCEEYLDATRSLQATTAESYRD